MRPFTVLIVDDERPIRASLRRLLSPEGFQLFEAPNGREAMALVAYSLGLPPPPGTESLVRPEGEIPPIDLVISDLRMPEASGLELLRFVRQTAPQIDVLLLTAFAAVSDVVSALKLGAFNFLEKPFEPEALLLEVKRAQLLALEKQSKAPAPAPTPGSGRIVGESPAMKELKGMISRVSQSEATVLILGESGTGKELVAQAIHESSKRASGPFVPVHCGAIPENLIESELFGHTKGAFTGAIASREGRFAQAEGGTIFLDEIGEMPLSMQVKLLRVLQERTYEPVGGSKPRHGDFRVLAATNRDLSAAVTAGTFRGDLYYRLNVVPIQVPALRDRKGDLPLLCQSFIHRQNSDRSASRLLPPDPACMEVMLRYTWPGNIRELEHLIERISVLKGDGSITIDDLPPVIRDAVGINMPSATLPAQGGARTMNLNGELNRLEVELIRTALKDSGGNKNRAAQALGLNRTTLIEKIKRLGLQSFADSLQGTGPVPSVD